MEPVGEARSIERSGSEGRPRPRVVVGVDGSPGSRAALAHALTAARQRGADLDVVSTFWLEALYSEFGWMVRSEVEPIRRATREQAQALIDEVRSETGPPAGSPEPRVRLIVEEGTAGWVLVDRSADADLLVVGSRGRGALRSLVLGSVALHCVTHARCPVVVVRPTGPGGATDRVVAGVDGSPGSRVALRAAIDEAVRRDAEVEAVAAVYLRGDTWIELETLPGTATIEGVRREVAARTERRVAEVLAERGEESPAPDVRVEVVDGAPAEVLVQQAEGAGLLVVGSRGWRALRGLLLGSVALHCVMHAPCPVMVLRPAPDDGTAPGA
ncbi:universal stress protein [Blastococcus sp. CCUG 61487]|uniref:universal stress protein n=1 Tax=Blastococcus sp. CCUG 61487 TaxID=1840703 RepID=UPI0010BFFB45|nr:universal stress protein [Blastococcus sp. CCUG 61487]TKJ17987.1 hypothetical protein A6V29_01210 [Blastococcus sp. CCUG 61487]